MRQPYYPPTHQNAQDEVRMKARGMERTGGAHEIAPHIYVTGAGFPALIVERTWFWGACPVSQFSFICLN